MPVDRFSSMARVFRIRSHIPLDWTVYFYVDLGTLKTLSYRMLTFQTAVAVLAEASCLAAPAFAFVAMAANGADAIPAHRARINAPYISPNNSVKHIHDSSLL